MTRKNAIYWIILAVVCLVLAGFVLAGLLTREPPPPRAQKPGAPQAARHPWQGKELPAPARTMLGQHMPLAELKRVLVVGQNCKGCQDVLQKVKWSPRLLKGLLIILQAGETKPEELAEFFPGLPKGAALAPDPDGVLRAALEIKGAPEYLELERGRLVYFTKGGRSIIGRLNSSK